jgi:type I restriction enzyme, S subunit
MNSFSEISLKDAVSFVVDNRGRSVPVQDVGIPLISTACISNEELHPDLSTERYVSDEIYRNWFRSHPQPGDIILTNKGSKNGEIALVPDPVNFCIAQDMVALRANSNLISPAYLFAILRSRLVQLRIKALNVDAVIPHFKKTDFDKLLIPLPSRRDQDFIGRVYLDISKKIELNRKTNETLEAMAKALFKSWFVDFDPVKAKAEGRPTGLPAEISDLFPDSFEDSELGEIPSGWRVGSLDQIGINPRETAKPEDMDSSDRYIGLEHMPRGSICLGESGQAEELESNKNRFRQGDLLFGKLRPYFKKTGYSQFDGVCSTDIVVVRKKGEYGVGFICCFLASDPFIDFTVAASSGTRMPRTSWKDMCEFPFAIPSKLLLCEFDTQFRPVINKITGNCIHSASLAVLRDALLPKLISGEIRIPDAEKMLEEVGI